MGYVDGIIILADHNAIQPQISREDHTRTPQHQLHRLHQALILLMTKRPIVFRELRPFAATSVFIFLPSVTCAS